MIYKFTNLFGKPEINNCIVPAMPYMGNKRKLSTKIFNEIYNTIGDFESFYDLFGGGGSMSITSLLCGHKTHYNELNTGIYNLFKHVLSGGEIHKKWVSREDFKNLKDGDDWYSGLVKCCWSFGNNQDDYLFGDENEKIKKLAHEIVINNCEESRLLLSKEIGLDIPKNIHRLWFSDNIKNKRFELQQLEQLEQLEQLQQLQQLERLQQLHFTNLSYNNVEIKNKNCVIYCDPPYNGTTKYQKSEFDYNVFYDWCLNNNNPVFISEYKMPIEFKCVMKVKHTCSLSATSTKTVEEKLFWNGKFINNVTEM